MNIALINPEYPSRSGRDHGGIATYVFNMANALAARNHLVYVLIRRGVATDSVSPSLRLHTFGSETLHPFFPFLERFVDEKIRWERGCSRALRRALLSIHRETPLDIVEVPEYNGLAYELDSALPFPVVAHFHTPTVLVDELNRVIPRPHHKRWYAFEARALRHARGFKCTSISLRDRIPACCGVPAERIAVIRNPMPTTPYDAIAKEHDLRGNRIDLLFSGRLERRKGAEIMQKAAEDILTLDQRINLTFAGETEVGETSATRTGIERAIRPELRNRLWFLGPLARSELAVVYCRSSLFLMPSLFDNAPNSLFEAMAAQLPVIAADSGGINEIIQHNENGLLFSPERPEELVASIRMLIDSPETATRLAERAYEEIATTYSPDTIAAQTLSFYERVIRG